MISVPILFTALFPPPSTKPRNPPLSSSPSYLSHPNPLFGQRVTGQSSSLQNVPSAATTNVMSPLRIPPFLPYTRSRFASIPARLIQVPRPQLKTRIRRQVIRMPARLAPPPRLGQEHRLMAKTQTLRHQRQVYPSIPSIHQVVLQ
jgi:hypothetical protein